MIRIVSFLPYFAVSKHPLKVSTPGQNYGNFDQNVRILAGIKCKKGCLHTAKYGKIKVKDITKFPMGLATIIRHYIYKLSTNRPSVDLMLYYNIHKLLGLSNTGIRLC
jgi:hypothetical protein